MPYPTPSSQLRSYVSTFKDSNETSFEEDESVVDKGSVVGAQSPTETGRMGLLESQGERGEEGEAVMF